MSQCASHAIGDLDVWLLSLCLWRSGAWWSEYAWSMGGFVAGSRGRCNRLALVDMKGRASEHCAREPSTAGHSRMRTNVPHMSKLEERIETVFRRDEGCGQNLTCTKLVVTTWSCMLLRRDQAAVIQGERQVFPQRSERGFAPKSW